ncbi:ParA family protein [Belnapia sp. F-4-1]|uniref:ParA family protein n=1 Tax=Belnapia sp. F-4-1 TaxID=1545443 RepID=UPI0011857B78|nr:ParA family protein [Belnapia sp. F-4-1]
MAAKATCRVLVLGGSKGGCGRSTIARNLMVAASLADINVVGADLDRQGTFLRWSERREVARQKLPQIVPAEVFSAEVGNWRSILDQVKSYQLAIVDTAPGVEHDMTPMLELCGRASLVLVPTSPSGDDLESVAPWFKTLTDAGANAEFVLNRANRRTRSYAAARTTLLRYGAVAPVEIPQLEEIMTPFKTGLSAVDYENSKAADAMNDLWLHVRRAVKL